MRGGALWWAAFNLPVFTAVPPAAGGAWAVVLPIHPGEPDPTTQLHRPTQLTPSLLFYLKLTPSWSPRWADCFLLARSPRVRCRRGGAAVGFQWKLLLISLQYLQGRQGNTVGLGRTSCRGRIWLLYLQGVSPHFYLAV